MSNPMPIYSHVVPKSQYRKQASKNGATKERSSNLPRTEFDPLNYNHGGQFHLLNEPKYERPVKEARRSKEDYRSSRRTQKVDPGEGKVEAYLRQNQVSIRQQQHRHSAVRQAEHRVNLRSLPLNDVVTSLANDRTPSDRHRPFPEREREGREVREGREGREGREHRRERDKERDREHDATPLSPNERRDSKVRKSTSSHKVTETGITTDKRRFFCREWAFQKIAHCLEQRPVSKTCGALILGEAGSGKTALCQELSAPGGGPQARQQRALARRLLARHFLQGHQESSLRPGEFVRSIAMQILSHSSRHNRLKDDSEKKDLNDTRNSEEELLIRRFKDMGDDGEDSSKPLLADSEDQRTDDEEPAERRSRTIDRLTEREAYLDAMIELPEILPRNSKAPTNPFLTDDQKEDFKIYENHENLFLRNLSQRQSKEIRNSRLLRQSSEPLNEKKPSGIQKSLSTDQKNDSASENEKSKSEKSESSPPRSRIPVASFRYPNKSDLRSSSVENSPSKSKEPKTDDAKSEEKDEAKELPEYTNILKEEPNDIQTEMEKLLEKKRAARDDVPPPIPSLPVSPRTLIANAYYDKLLSEPEIQQALLPQNLEKNPDECFKKALLFPLLEIDPPKQCLFLLVDAIDEGTAGNQKEEKLESTAPSNSILCLLSRHQHLFPQWLLPVCTSRRKPSTDTLTGFRKITLDELQRAHVSADVQRYVLARLDTEPRLRARVSSDSTAAAAAAAALDHLRIKSDGCLLYLEKVLDGVADGFIGLREIKEIPGTLNGLYLWLAQRLFHGRRFTKVRPLLDVLLASRCGVTQEMLYKCLLTKEYSVTREDFHRRLHALRRILVMESTTGHLQIFHHSFAKWLLDVKHCTRRYLCDQREGDATLAMYYTLDAKRLSALEIHNYVYHMTNLEAYLTAPKMSKAMSQILSKEGGSSYQLPPELDWHTIHLLWVLDSGCDVDCALKRDCFDLQPAEVKSEEKDLDPESEGKESISVGPTSSLESIMPSLVGTERFPREAKVLRALREMCNKKAGLESPPEPEPLPSEELSKEDPTQQMSIEPEPVDPAALMQLLATGDDHGFVELLKTCPALLPTLPDGGSGLLSAAARGGLPRAASALLAAGVSPVADSEGCSPLRAAAWAGHTEVVEVLLEYNAEVDCVDADNRTALRAAAWSGHEAVVTRLLAANASPDLPDGEGRTALIAAAYMGHADIVKALLDAGAKTDHADEDGRTALAVASLCASGAACAAILIERGADVNKPDRDKATPLLVAAFEGHTEICELLLEAEADIEASDACGRTALWAAASAGHAAAVRVLLFWGACVDNMDAEGRTVLSTAAAQGNVEVVRQLLDRGLDEHHRDNSGWTPLHYAAFEGHVEVCEALLEAGAKVDAADNDGKGALMLAAQEGHSRLLETLADDWAAPVDQRAHDGKTALRLAALEGHFDTVRALYERGADVDAVDADKRSTLYVLAIDNRLAMARYLICECGASVDIRDAEGRTPLHVSAWQGHTDMVNLLIKVGGADVDGRDRCLRTALHAAAWRGRAAALRALLQHQAAPAAVCTQGATPLGIAAQEGHEECVMWLLQYGADPLQADHCGRTPAKVAWRAGHANICRLLERFTAPSAPAEDTPVAASRGSPDYKRRSVHSSNSTKSSSNLTATSTRSHHDDTDEKASRAHLSLSFAQQVARCGRRERDRDNAIPEHRAVEQDANLRSYLANEKDFELRNTSERDRRRDQRHLCDRESTSPLYASPPHSPLCSPVVHDNGSQPASLTPHPAVTDQHFNRDTHMRIILGRDSKPPPDKSEGAGRSRYTRLVSTLGRARGRIFKKTKGKRNGIVTNPAMRLVNNVKNGLDSAAANIRRTGVALAASAGSNNPAVKSNAFQFQWRRETPL